MSAIDRLWREWQKAQHLADRFESRPLKDPIRAKWVQAAATALRAVQDEERRLLDPDAKLHP